MRTRNWVKSACPSPYSLPAGERQTLSSEEEIHRRRRRRVGTSEQSSRETRARWAESVDQETRETSPVQSVKMEA